MPGNESEKDKTIITLPVGRRQLAYWAAVVYAFVAGAALAAWIELGRSLLYVAFTIVTFLSFVVWMARIVRKS